MDDCLRDLPASEGGWLLVFEHGEALQMLDGEDVETLKAILESVKQFWQSKGKIFSAGSLTD